MGSEINQDLVKLLNIDAFLKLKKNIVVATHFFPTFGTWFIVDFLLDVQNFAIATKGRIFYVSRHPEEASFQRHSFALAAQTARRPIGVQGQESGGRRPLCQGTEGTRRLRWGGGVISL